MRTEFLGLVEPRVARPLIAIKGSADALLEEAAELDPAEMHELHRIIAEQGAHMRGLIRDLLGCLAHRLGHPLGHPRALGGNALVERARSTFLSGASRGARTRASPVGAPPRGGAAGSNNGHSVNFPDFFSGSTIYETGT